MISPVSRPVPPWLRLSAHLGFVVLGVAAIFNLGALSIAESGYEKLEETSARVLQTEQVGRAIDRLRFDLEQAESGTRGFLVTGDEAYLAPALGARQRLADDLEALAALVMDNGVQTTQLATVRRLVADKLEELDGTVDARRKEGFDAARALVLTTVGKIAMATIGAALDGMVQEEQRVKGARTASLRDHQRSIRLGFLAEASLNLLLVTLGALFLGGELRRQRREREQLAARGDTLERQVQERTAQLTELSRFQETVREDEKKRVARELHDELGGTLTAAKIDLQLVANALRKDPTVTPRLARINSALDDAIAVKRRIIEDLRPTLLDNLGVEAALRWQCEEFAKRTGCPCKLRVEDVMDTPPDEHSIAMYRIVQEALTNIAKYAHAKSVVVELVQDVSSWRLRVIDDGVGIDPAKQHHPTSHGLISIRERVRSLGGTVAIHGAPGQGTIVDLRLPIDARAAEVEALAPRPAPARL